jgi:hypothetical protein
LTEAFDGVDGGFASMKKVAHVPVLFSLR